MTRLFVLGWQTDKREIASQARNDRIVLSSRGTKRSRLFGVGKQPKERLLRREFCHREERGDLAFYVPANRQKRDCFVGNSVIARNVAISVVRGWHTDKREIAALCSQPPEGALTKYSCHREERSDLGCSGLANNQKRDCRAALAMTRLFVLGENG